MSIMTDLGTIRWHIERIGDLSGEAKAELEAATDSLIETLTDMENRLRSLERAAESHKRAINDLASYHN